MEKEGVYFNAHIALNYFSVWLSKESTMRKACFVSA